MAYMEAQHQFDAAIAEAAAVAPAAARTGFTPLEWNVIALARRDGLSSLQSPGPLSRALGGLFGLGSTSILADPRLEALRRLAVQAWHRGFAVPVSEIARFKLAGYTMEQAEALLASIGVVRSAPPQRRAA